MVKKKGKKPATSVSNTLVLLACALITAIANIVAINWNTFFSSSESVQLDPNEDEKNAEIRRISADTGEWVRVDPDVTYLAETNGIVSAISGGDGIVKEGVIFEGGTVQSMEVRTRFRRYDGAILPVRKGRYWKVQSEAAGNDTILVQWLAFPSGS